MVSPTVVEHNNIHIIGVLKGKEREQGIENLLKKIMTENFPDLVRKMIHKSRKCRESKTK